MNVDYVREIALKRQDGYWASKSLPSREDISRSALHAVYNAVMAAAIRRIQLFTGLDRHNIYQNGLGKNEPIVGSRLHEYR